MNKKSWLLSLLCLFCLMAKAAPTDFQTSKTKVSVEFYTPSIVRVVKSPVDHKYNKESMVVTAAPSNVEVVKNGNKLSSSELTVSVDSKTGSITFSTKAGKTLLKEKASQFDQRKDGPDAGAYRVTQSFTLDKDEAIYGLGTIQNGKMNRRGEHKLMEQSNLEDFQSVLQSVKGWGIYWDNYSRTQFDEAGDKQQRQLYASIVQRLCQRQADLEHQR